MTTSATDAFATKISRINVESIKFGSIHDELPVVSDKETKNNLLEAAQIIGSTDNIVGFPTETVYGLGGSAVNDSSVKNIFKAKNRPSDNPLIVHISSLSQLHKIIKANRKDESLMEIPEIYKPLIEKFWPGPLSILIPIDVDLGNTVVDKDIARFRLSKFVTNNLDTVAIRFPSDPVARSLIALSDTPIAAPSANTSTKPSPTMAAHVYNDLKGKIPLILDGGSCNIGLESTVINGLANPPTLLRPGGLSVKEIKKVPGYKDLVTEVNIKKNNSEPVRTPGMKYKHYSPSANVYLLINKTKSNHNFFKSKEFQQLFEANKSDKLALVSELQLESFEEKNEQLVLRDLGQNINAIQFNMFRLLREMDQLSVKNVFVILNDKTLEDEDGLAVINRLGKAASQKVYI